MSGNNNGFFNVKDALNDFLNGDDAKHIVNNYKDLIDILKKGVEILGKTNEEIQNSIDGNETLAKLYELLENLTESVKENEEILNQELSQITEKYTSLSKEDAKEISDYVLELDRIKERTEDIKNEIFDLSDKISKETNDNIKKTLEAELDAKKKILEKNIERESDIVDKVDSNTNEEYKDAFKEKKGDANYISNYKDALKEYNAGLKSIENSAKEIKKTFEEASEEAEKMAEHAEKMKTAWQAIGVMGSFFLEKLKEAVNYSLEYEQTAYNTAKFLGMTRTQAEAYNKSMFDTFSYLSDKLKMSQEDIFKFQTRVAEATGRSTYLGKQQALVYGSMTKILGEQTTDNIVASMDMMGNSISESGEQVAKLLINSSKQGLTLKKTSEAFAKNIKIASQINFREGIDGVNKMTMLSEKLKFNMESINSMAMKSGNIEGAIEMAANLQKLGGNFRREFSDPMRLLFESLNDAESLTERVVRTFSGMGRFNKDKGEVEIGAYNKVLIRQAAEAMGISYEDAFSMASQQVKYREMSGSFQKGLTEEQKNGVSSRARFDSENKEWVVDYLDAKGEKHTDALKDVNSEVANVIMQGNTTEDAILATIKDNHKLLITTLESQAKLMNTNLERFKAINYEWINELARKAKDWDLNTLVGNGSDMIVDAIRTYSVLIIGAMGAIKAVNYLGKSKWGKRNIVKPFKEGIQSTKVFKSASSGASKLSIGKGLSSMSRFVGKHPISLAIGAGIASYVAYKGLSSLTSPDAIKERVERHNNEVKNEVEKPTPSMNDIQKEGEESKKEAEENVAKARKEANESNVAKADLPQNQESSIGASLLSLFGLNNNNNTNSTNNNNTYMASANKSYNSQNIVNGNTNIASNEDLANMESSIMNESNIGIGASVLGMGYLGGNYGINKYKNLYLGNEVVNSSKVINSEANNISKSLSNVAANKSAISTSVSEANNISKSLSNVTSSQNALSTSANEVTNSSLIKNTKNIKNIGKLGKLKSLGKASSKLLGGASMAALSAIEIGSQLSNNKDNRQYLDELYNTGQISKEDYIKEKILLEQENNKNLGSSIGGVIGGTAGTLLGSGFGSIITSTIGYTIGDYIGSNIGKMLSPNIAEVTNNINKKDRINSYSYETSKFGQEALGDENVGLYAAQAQIKSSDILASIYELLVNNFDKGFKKDKDKQLRRDNGEKVTSIFDPFGWFGHDSFFAKGGIVKANNGLDSIPGTSYYGDKIHARVNSGEMILTRQQQKGLFDFIKFLPVDNYSSPTIINQAKTESLTSSNPNTTPNKPQDINLKVGGTIYLNANGQNVDISSLLKDDKFMFELSRMITSQMSKNNSGGKIDYNDIRTRQGSFYALN